MGWEDDRGVSEVLGAILLFGIIVMAIGGYQAFVVPSINAEAEFDHSNDVKNEMVELRSATMEDAASNEPRSATVTLGLQYPTRLLGVNPPASSGTLRTVEGGGITLESDDSDLKTICGTTGEPDTKFLEYQPDYNEHSDDLPLELEHSMVYKDADDGALFHTGQVLVRGNQINVIRLEAI